MSLTPTEDKVLGILACADRDFGYSCFRALARRTRLSIRVVRRACRSLARKGLAQYARGLTTEDGEMAGAGYAATDLGRETWDEPASEEKP